jgi:hypothetical protein
MVFYASPGVGADQFAVKDGRLCRVNDSVMTTEDPNAAPPDSDNTKVMRYQKEYMWPLVYVGKGKPPVWRMGRFGKTSGSVNATLPKAALPGITISPDHKPTTTALAT